MVKKKVTGIGGILFKSDNPEKTKEWYAKHLGFNTDEHGTTFQWQDSEGQKGHTVWSPMDRDHAHFDEGDRDYMLNLRVDDLDMILEEMKADGVEQIGDIQSYDYGRFAYVKDPDGMKIELWEPNDQSFDEMAEARTP